MLAVENTPSRQVSVPPGPIRIPGTESSGRGPELTLTGNLAYASLLRAIRLYDPVQEVLSFNRFQRTPGAAPQREDIRVSGAHSVTVTRHTHQGVAGFLFTIVGQGPQGNRPVTTIFSSATTGNSFILSQTPAPNAP